MQIMAVSGLKAWMYLAYVVILEQKSTNKPDCFFILSTQIRKSKKEEGALSIWQIKPIIRYIWQASPKSQVMTNR